MNHNCHLLSLCPYAYTSGDVIFTVFADRTGVPDARRGDARAEFFAMSQPCLRSSDLGKRYGWGIHADAAGPGGCVYGVETPEYAEFVAGRRRSDADEPVTLTRALRSSRRRAR